MALFVANVKCGYWLSQFAKYRTRSSAVAVIADRTACSILTLFIVSTTCRPLNKKSVCCQTAIITANSQSAHLSARQSRHTPRSRRSHRTALCRVPTRSRRKLRYNCVPVLGLRCASFFVVHFVAKRYILQQKCQKGQIGTLMLGARWYNFWPRTPTLRATMQSVTDRQTDRRTDRRTTGLCQ